MTSRIAVACACVLVGLGAIVGVASTAGPPEGYAVFHDRGVRVELPTDFRAIRRDDGDVIVAVLGPDGAGVQVATVPTRGRSLAAYEQFRLQNVRTAAPGVQDVRREDVDVSGADEARRLTFRDGDRDVTMVIARDGERFSILSIDVPRGAGDELLDVESVEDSFAITG